MTPLQLLWDWGTAYDLFMSLAVLHDPTGYGVRGAWAAGVRARLSPQDRETLEQIPLLGTVPFHWIYTLPEPKDGATVLWALGRIPPPERVPLLTLDPGVPADAEVILRDIAHRGSWDESDVQALQMAFRHGCEHEEGAKPLSAEKIAKPLDLWANASEYGGRLLDALRAYQEVFFAEEERRIRPALQQALARAQEQAERLELADLLEELSQGVRFDKLPQVAELVLVPSYWITPLVLFGEVTVDRHAWLFGARPADASLVPGEMVPEALLRVLKALADPTRLRILHYLAQETLTPAELSRRLRLRAPTVTHHLKALRFAGLVQIAVGETKTTRSYAARPEAVSTACASLMSFLQKDEHD